MRAKVRRSRAWFPVGIVALLALVAGASARLTGCQDAAKGGATAQRIATRTQLIGGPKALGEVGDFLLENDKIRVVIQDKGFSRGFGVYGGSLIDADLVRPVEEGQQSGGNGRDQFGELFPLFFLEALVPEEVEVLSDGSNGDTAQVRVSGSGGDFLTLTRVLNQAIVNSREFDGIGDLLEPDKLDGDPKLRFSTTYALAPGERHVTIETTLVNITGEDVPIPSMETSVLGAAVGLPAQLDVPLGHVLLFGAGNRVFAPGYGYDIRFSLEENYGKGSQLPFPALPGLIADGMITSSSNGVSYGFFSSGGDTPNFAQNRVGCPLDEAGDPTECGENTINYYEDTYGVETSEYSLMVPFLASAFTGVFYSQAPSVLKPGEAFSFKSIFVVGDGDVASVMDEVQEIRGVARGTFEGTVLDQVTLAPAANASVMVYDANGRPYNQFFTNSRGRFGGDLPEGRWTARVLNRPMVSEPVAFDIQKGDTTFRELVVPSAAQVRVHVRDEAGRDLPAKVTAVGTIAPENAGKITREFLFDLEIGQSYRASDFIPDDPSKPETLEFIEAVEYTDNGEALLSVRPDRPYTIYISRGMEYDLQQINVNPKAGEVSRLSTVLTREVESTGYIGADFHLHAGPSLDSDLDLTERVVSCAGEGLELAVSTDHNFVTDYRPFIERAGIQEFMNSMVGLELTTLESGHFNGFPIQRDISQITRGSFEWSLRTPDEVFNDLRALGKYGPENTIVQVNHARDSVLGYFSQYGFHPLDAKVDEIVGSAGLDFSKLIAPNGPAFRRFRTEDGQPCDPEENPAECKLYNVFSENFDAMEVFNGKRLEQVRHFRRPQNLAEYDLSEELQANLPEAGTILCSGGDVAFPGMVDDWFNLLNRGRYITAMGNSDSHEAHLEECAFPRTFVNLGTDDPALVDDLAVVRAIQNQQAIITNGPFVELLINGAPVGSRIQDSDGTVDVTIRVQAASWVAVDQVTLIANGENLDTIEVEMTRGKFEYTGTYQMDKDTWFVAEAKAEPRPSSSLFPVISPLEVPPVLITDAVGSLAGAFGFGASELESLAPALTRFVTPYAITNPIWVSQGAEFEPPGIARRKCEGFGVVNVEGDAKPRPLSPAEIMKREKKRVMRPSLWFPRIQGNTHDIRIIFDQVSSHNHSH